MLPKDLIWVSYGGIVIVSRMQPTKLTNKAKILSPRKVPLGSFTYRLAVGSDSILVVESGSRLGGFISPSLQGKSLISYSSKFDLMISKYVEIMPTE